MFGEVMGKTKNQLRREVLKMRMRQLKRHIPVVVTGATALYYAYRFNQVGKNGVVIWMGAEAKQAWNDESLAKYDGCDDTYIYSIRLRGDNIDA